MTLNFSPCSAFPPRPSRVDGDYVPPTVGNWLDWETDELYDGGNDSWSMGSSGSYDPIDLLPSDPFGMDMSSTFTAAIAGWFEDLGARPGDFEVGGDDLAAGLELLWNSALLYSSESQLDFRRRFDGWGDNGLLGTSGNGSQDGCVGEFPNSDTVGAAESLLGTSGNGSQDGCVECPNSNSVEVAESSGAGSAPHEGLFFSLGCLGVRDLLSVEMVCRSLRSTVQNDTLLWKCIHIGPQLGERITDDALLKLTRRAQGSLECLSLTGCSKITDDGLKRVLEGNPKLTKLGVPGCVRLTIDGLINNLKVLKSLEASGIKHLKLGSVIVTAQRYEDLKLLLGLDQLQHSNALKPRFYHSDYLSLPCDDERAIDIEVCPGCQKLKVVYDCTMEGCQGKEGPEQCRACDLCIPRCVQCGRCIKNCEYTENFFMENLCSGCCKRLAPPVPGENGEGGCLQLHYSSPRVDNSVA